jgi:hypothetical protein
VYEVLDATHIPFLHPVNMERITGLEKELAILSSDLLEDVSDGLRSS